MKTGWMTVVLGGALLVATTASAQQTTVVEQPPASQTVVERERTTRAYMPNIGLITSGAVLFAGAYIPSMIVAAESSHPSDDRLWIPVVGPWLDLADRGGCPVGASSCDTETTNKVLLIGDGILQGVGVVSFVAGFLFPMKVEEREVAKAKVRVLPMQMGRGPSMGAGIVGTF